MSYRIENKFQDGRWEDAGHDWYGNRAAAAEEAENLSGDAIFYGMTRVVDTATGLPVATFQAGSGARA